MKISSSPPEFFVAGGTLWREARSYIHRPADDELLKLALTGEYCNVLAARQMGKSSLMVQTANHLHETGIRTAILDISTLGGGISTPDQWFFGFLDELTVQLGLHEDVNAWWEAHTSYNPVQRFSNFLRDVVLHAITDPIVIFVDEIDSALGMAFTDDFFAAIRATYNARATEAQFQRLTFILLGVARPADLIRDRNRTPYNIGTHIDLNDFSLSELGPFQAVFDNAYPNHGAEILQWVLNWTNGQPYLTQKLCAELIHSSANALTPEDIEHTVTRLFLAEEARKESNLRAIQDRIEGSPNKIKMLQIYEQILRQRSVLDEERSPAKNELKLTGLIRPTAQGQLIVRNRIYQTVFDLPWIRRNLPQTRTRQIAWLASLLALVAFSVAGYAIYYQRQIQPSLTYVEQFQTSNSPDVKLTSLARLLELDDRSQSQALELYGNLPQNEKLKLFTELSDPQNIAKELVTVTTAVYQSNANTPEGNELLTAMKTVLGRIGAPGAPSLKTEIEFWLKGREESNDNQNALTASSFYDSAFAESVNRGQANYMVRFDRAMSLIILEDYASALKDLQVVWKQAPNLHAQIQVALQSNPRLANYIIKHPEEGADLVSLVTPEVLTSLAETLPTPSPNPVISPSPAAKNATPSPFTGWIAFGYGTDNAREIMLMQPTTGSRQQITNNQSIEEAPSFSPGNGSLVYASYRTQSGWELYTYDLHRGIEQQITSFAGEAHFPVWSPVAGDTRILFEGRTSEPRATNIWMVDIATGEVTQITHGGSDTRPCWSPDGQQILFGRATADTSGDGAVTVSDASDIFVRDLASGVEKDLTNSPTYNDFNFAWSPDGKWIVFTSIRRDVNADGSMNQNDSENLFMIPATGGPEQVLNLRDQAIFSPSWSPDGRFILVLVMEGVGQNAIWRYDTWTQDFVRITEAGPYYHPRYSNPP